MSNVPADLHYTKEHEWIKVAADGTAVIGIKIGRASCRER